MSRTRRPYPSDLTDQEWALLEPLLASPERRGRPPKWPARRVADAVFYLLRMGCAWRMLPREYPPWQTVYYHFWKWRRHGRLRRAHDRLREALRESEGRDRNPSGAVIDSQAVKGTGAGGPERGYDGAKRLSGRKRHLLVYTGGLVLGAHVHAASLHDRDGAQRLLNDELEEELPRLELLWSDGAYTHGFREWLQEALPNRHRAARVTHRSQPTQLSSDPLARPAPSGERRTRRNPHPLVVSRVIRYFVNKNTVAPTVESRSDGQRYLLLLLVHNGMRGFIRVPLDEDARHKRHERYARFFEQRTDRLRTLIEERTGDPDLQEKVYAGLLHRVQSPRL